MQLEHGITYKITHRCYPNCQAFATCLGERTHMSIYNTHDDYYRSTKDLERMFNKNGFKLEPVQI